MKRLSDRLEAAQAAQEKTRDRLAAASLTRLSELRSIVINDDALMALCYRLEARLTNAENTCRRLLGALLAEAWAQGTARELEVAE